MVHTSLVTREKKTSVLRKGTFGCLAGIPTINVTQGCMLGCVYCYARGYPGLPNPETVILFSNLAQRLPGELSRKRRPVSHVLFNTASDSFQPHPDILNTSIRLMEILLERSISLSFLTKGVIPHRFFDLVDDSPHHAPLISARIGMVSLKEDYQKTFEPHAAAPGVRLRNIERLMEAGIRTEVRIDPVIPFVTDAEEDFDCLFGELSARGVTRASISVLHLRPAIHAQLEKTLPPVSVRLIETMFRGSAWRTVGSSTMSKLAPGAVRERIYDRAREIAGEHGVTLTVCACKNPDIPGELCTDPIDTGTGLEPTRRQMLLPLGGDDTVPEVDEHQNAISR